MYGGRSVFPHRFCSAKGPLGCPGRELNPGPTEWQAGALTIEIHLTPIELHLTSIELHLSPIELHLTPFELHPTPN